MILTQSRSFYALRKSNMMIRKHMFVMLVFTVLAPIVIFTDQFASLNKIWVFRNDFTADISTSVLKNDLKESMQIIYSVNSGQQSMEHKSRALYTTTNGDDRSERENVIKLVTDGLHKGNESVIIQKHRSTSKNGIEEKTKSKIISSQKISNNAFENTEIKRGQKYVQTFRKVDMRGTKSPKTVKQNEQTSVPDIQVRQLKDLLIRAKVYLSLSATRNNPHFIRELRVRMKESQRALGDATRDSELPRNACDKSKAMEQTLAKGKQIQDDCAVMVKKLRAMLQAVEDQIRVHKRQAMFLTQLTAKTLPKGLHCLPLRLTDEYYGLNSSEQVFPNQNKLEDQRLYHYALFSDNVLATSVVVNSTVFHAKDSSNHVFHIVTDRLNYAAMRMWFLANPPGEATVQVQNVEEFTWLNSSYSPVLKQLDSKSMIDFYFKARHAHSDSNLKFRNPKYLSVLNHLRFYLPEIFPNLDKVLFLDDDIVVQKDLTGLWHLDLKGNINGAVETCRESFHRFDRYLNFSNPLISKNFDRHACGWAYGMNIFDLKEWKKQNITAVYHKWQNLNHDRRLWKLGTLPPGLITFWKHTFSLERLMHVLGLGYDPNVSEEEIVHAAVIHYNGNMKPWLEISLPRYRNYWTKFVDYDQVYLRDCNITP